MQPRFENIASKTIIGNRLTMSFAQNKTGILWQHFMPRRSEIGNQISEEFYSIEVYPSGFFEDFRPTNNFEKWAGVEVRNETEPPVGMASLIIPQGMYAVFTHRGPASEGPGTYQYIFQKWLPASVYMIDDRPHFAIMGTKYKHEQQDSEEDIYIPIKPKQAWK